jgi:hypothetical protein
MASHQTRHRGDIQFAFKQEFDGEKPLFLPSRLLSTVPFTLKRKMERSPKLCK